MKTLLVRRTAVALLAGLVALAPAVPTLAAQAKPDPAQLATQYLNGLGTDPQETARIAAELQAAVAAGANAEALAQAIQLMAQHRVQAETMAEFAHAVKAAGRDLDLGKLQNRFSELVSAGQKPDEALEEAMEEQGLHEQDRERDRDQLHEQDQERDRDQDQSCDSCSGSKGADNDQSDDDRGFGSNGSNDNDDHGSGGFAGG
ncbi:MAG: hypothetical protein QJR13_02080, partial [Bacillota bacterium]|nr:hypothetical protein [Bacillota bacterium]